MVVSKSSGMARFDYSGIASGATLGSSSEGSSTNTINTQKSNTTKRKKRRHRTIFTQFQIDELEKAFQVSNIPHFSYDPSQKRLRCWFEGEWEVDISANAHLLMNDHSHYSSGNSYRIVAQLETLLHLKRWTEPKKMKTFFIDRLKNGQNISHGSNLIKNGIKKTIFSCPSSKKKPNNELKSPPPCLRIS